MRNLGKRIGLCTTGYKGARVLERLQVNMIDWVIDYDETWEIAGICNIHNIKLFNKREALSSLDSDLIFFIGWQYLITPKHNYVVIHDSLLPILKGFCPTVTALINELPLGVSAFKPNSEIDSGLPLGQRKIITNETKIARVLDLVASESAGLVEDISKDETPLHKWDRKKGESFSIWRDELDYQIDWSQSAERLKRTVDALGHPYEGAQTSFSGNRIVIEEAEVIEMNFVDQKNNTGKIWSLTENKPIVVCGKNALKILKYRGPTIKKLRTRLEKMK